MIMKILSRLTSGLKYLLFLTGAIIFLFIMLEGCSGLLFSILKIPRTRIVAERIHTEYDPLLGWVNKPDYYVEDMYGPGKNFQTNSQRFRNRNNFPVQVPPGKSRWICSGDSFTLGYGVGNNDTWCAVLSKLIPGLETVNMGQGGYGIDQAYLWFQRDGVKVEYDTLLFAFITADLTRALSPVFRDYPKPLLTVREGKIIKLNVPVPCPNFFVRHLPRARAAINSLRVIKLIRLFLKPGDESKSSFGGGGDPIQRVKDVTAAIFDSLHKFHQKKNRRVLFIYLPTRPEYRDKSKTAIVRSFLSAKAQKNGWILIDLFEDFRSLKPEEVDLLFLQRNLPGYIASRGHYTKKGNQYIAKRILEEIAGRRETEELLNSQ